MCTEEFTAGNLDALLCFLDAAQEVNFPKPQLLSANANVRGQCLY